MKFAKFRLYLTFHIALLAVSLAGLNYFNLKAATEHKETDGCGWMKVTSSTLASVGLDAPIREEDGKHHHTRAMEHMYFYACFKLEEESDFIKKAKAEGFETGTLRSGK